MHRTVLATDFCIRVLRDRPPSFRTRFNAEANSLRISTIVLTELLHAAAKSARTDHNRREVVRFAADLERSGEHQGQVIGGYDLLIAGHARSHGLVVVTRNLGEFNRVPGLRCEDWADTAKPA